VELQGGVSAVVAMGGPDAPPADGGVRAYLAGTERGVIFHVELSQGHGRAAPMLESHFEPVRPALTLTLTLALSLTLARPRWSRCGATQTSSACAPTTTPEP